MIHDRLSFYQHGDLVFNVDDAGPIDGIPVLLLHGWPQSSSSWGPVAELLHEAGYRTLAPNQRGYSPGASPRGRRQYRIPLLASDTVALIDAIDAGPVHIIGHDWGAMVGYAVAAIYPNRVRTLTSLAVPHPGAFMKSLLSSTQALRSWYMLAFQLPGIPEAVIRKWPDRFVRGLESTGQAHENAVRDTEFINKNGITTTLNWYRAIPLTDPRTVKDKVTVPTLHVYGAKDGAIARRGAELNGEFIVAPYTLKILENTSHWIPEEEPGEVVRLFKEMVSAFG